MQAVVHGHLLVTLATLGELLEATEALVPAMVEEAMELAEAEEKRARLEEEADELRGLRRWARSVRRRLLT